MADTAQDRKLPATQRRIEKAREEGQVARSRDLGHFGALGTGVGLLAVFAPDITTWLGSYSKEKPAELVPLTNAIAVTTIWSTDIGAGNAGKGTNLKPRIEGGTLFAADVDGEVVALDATTGREIWSVDIDTEVSGGPGSGEGLVVVGTVDGEVVALDAATGGKRWTARVSSEVLSTPAVAQGVVVVHSLDGRLTGLDAADGRQRWQYERTASGLGLRGSSSPVISGGNAICGLAGGRLVAVELATGFAVWETTITLPAGRTELERVVDILGFGGSHATVALERT